MALYCERCGRELDEVEVPAGYDLHTGERVYQVYFACPKTSILKLVFCRMLGLPISDFCIHTVLPNLADTWRG